MSSQNDSSNSHSTLMGNPNDLPPTYDTAVTNPANPASGQFISAGSAEAKDVKVPPPSEQPQYAAPAGPPPPFVQPQMPATTVYNYVNPITHDVVASLLPPDHPQMVCLQQGHLPYSRFGVLGIMAAILWFPLGIACCLLDQKVQCRRCGQIIDAGLCA